MARFKDTMKMFLRKVNPTYRHIDYTYDEVIRMGKLQQASSKSISDFFAQIDRQCTSIQNKITALHQSVTGEEPVVNNVYEVFQGLYDCFLDQQSKSLFLARFNSSMTDSFYHLFYELAHMERNVDGRDLLTVIRDNISGQKDTLILAWGEVASHRKVAGHIKHVFLQLGIQFSFYIGNADNSGGKAGIPSITIQEAVHKAHEGAIIIVPGGKVMRVLVENGCNANSIVFKKSQWTTQYFDKSLIAPQKDEVFIDGGAFDMQDSANFANWCNGEYSAIYAFEPDEKNYKKCKNAIKSAPFVQDRHKSHYISNSGLHKNPGHLAFSSGLGGSSHLIKSKLDAVDSLPLSHESMIAVTSIDHTLCGKKATFIKLDVEGAELDALEGARDTILKHRPRMAIAIYHNREDILTIPLYILSLNPTYKFYLRHYSTWRTETVLYCV